MSVRKSELSICMILGLLISNIFLNGNQITLLEVWTQGPKATTESYFIVSLTLLLLLELIYRVAFPQLDDTPYLLVNSIKNELTEVESHALIVLLGIFGGVALALFYLAFLIVTGLVGIVISSGQLQALLSSLILGTIWNFMSSTDYESIGLAKPPASVQFAKFIINSAFCYLLISLLLSNGIWTMLGLHLLVTSISTVAFVFKFYQAWVQYKRPEGTP